MAGSPKSDFWCVDVAVKPGQEFCAVVNRLPKFKNRPNDLAENNRRAQVRHAMCSAVQFMLEHPGSSKDIWGQISSGLIAARPDAHHREDASPVKAPADLSFAGKKFWILHTDVKGAQIAAMPQGPTPELLKLVDNLDPHAINDMFKLFFQYNKQDKVPDTCDDAQVFTLMNRNRLKQVGDHIGQWFAASVKEDGMIKWDAFPLYKPKYNDKGWLQHVIHWSGSIGQVPAEIWIDRSWPLMDPVSAEEARFQKGSTEHKCWDFFADDQKPKSRRLDKKGRDITALMQQALTMIDDKKKEVQALCEGPVMVNFNDRTKRMRDQALKNAREKLARTRSREPVCRSIVPALASSPAKSAHNEGNLD